MIMYYFLLGIVILSQIILLFIINAQNNIIDTLLISVEDLKDSNHDILDLLSD